MKQKITILGAGESGTGAAILAKKKGYEVFVSDMGEIHEKHLVQLKKHEINFESGLHTYDKITDSDVVVKSPGIPEKSPLIQELKEKGTPVIDELEFAFQYTDAKIIAITGTNGKTTTTMLLHHILQTAGWNVGVAGNIGKSLALQVAEKDYDNYVVEVSSFQLDGIDKFKPDTALILNITPDHLDRYENNILKYVYSKFRITKNQTSEDTLIVYNDGSYIDSEIEKLAIQPEMKKFSIKKAPFNHAWVEQEGIVFEEGKTLYSDSIAIKGPHNKLNAMAAVLAARSMGLDWAVIEKGLKTFRNAAHRLEYVDTVKEVKFYNDSKATNVESTKFALQSFEEKINWIAGGVDKGNEYEDVMSLVNEKVKTLVCLGVNNEKLKEAFHEFLIKILETKDMNEAVKMAFKNAEPNDVVLLSPACASFDLFDNYEDRGEKFKKAVANLKEQEK